MSEEKYLLVDELLLNNVLEQPKWWIKRRYRGIALAIIVIGCVTIGMLANSLLLQYVEISNPPSFTQVVTVLLAVSASLFAYYQWVDSRRIDAQDNFYSRLTLTNNYAIGCPSVQKYMHKIWSGADEADFHCAMFTCLELDNLEFVIFKYEYGMVAEKLLERSLRMFNSRCSIPEFRNLATRQIRVAGYDANTIAVAEYLVARNRKSVPPDVFEQRRAA